MYDNNAQRYTLIGNSTYITPFTNILISTESPVITACTCDIYCLDLYYQHYRPITPYRRVQPPHDFVTLMSTNSFIFQQHSMSYQ